MTPLEEEFGREFDPIRGLAAMEAPDEYYPPICDICGDAPRHCPHDFLWIGRPASLIDSETLEAVHALGRAVEDVSD